MLCRVVIVILFCSLVSPVYAKQKPKQIIQNKTVSKVINQTKIPSINQIIQASSTPNISTQNTVLKKSKNPISIFGTFDSGDVYATASGYKTSKCKVPTSFTIGIEYDLGKFEKIEYGIGVRYLLKRTVADFKTEFGMIPVYGFGRMDIGNNILITGRLGYEIPKMETKVTGKWEGDFCYGVGVGYQYNQNIRFLGEYSINKAKYTLDDFKMNWDYNVISLMVQYQL